MELIQILIKNFGELKILGEMIGVKMDILD
jgi:hypothetical protein